MPVKVWESDESVLYSRVVTQWDTDLTAEQYLSEAEELDKALDCLLDDAMATVRERSGQEIPTEFGRAWSVGNALHRSGVLEHPALQNEPLRLLWRALSKKCRTGARSNRVTEMEWITLRPKNAGEPRREGGRLDYFEMCRWLAEQDILSARATFGASVRNVWQMLERPTLRPLALRAALLEWLSTLSEAERHHLLEPQLFAELMKSLRNRWPDRGPGSAKRPVHYSVSDLRSEIAVVLGPFRSTE